MSAYYSFDETDPDNVTLYLRGEWSPDLDRVIASSNWHELVLHGVDWLDYMHLVPHADRIEAIKILLGPESSEGLELLSAIKSLCARETFRPPVDFRDYAALECLDVPWDKKCTQNFGSETVKTMRLSNVGGEDLSWIPKGSHLEVLVIGGGRLKSVRGVSTAESLRELELESLSYCEDIAEVRSLARLERLLIETPKLVLDGIAWLDGLSSLETLKIHSKVSSIDWAVIGRHESLRVIEIASDTKGGESDESIIARLEGGGRSCASFERFVGKVDSFAITLEG